ncbi:MAG: (d)CMP kinase, partial [Planctomycetaceae bacterium]|nr:(d)CMP kinase [Planctomycetaceae bacterium]
MIVTIDGPAGTGKSTAARSVAAAVGFEYLDTGAMYRVIALLALEAELDPHAESDVSGLARQTEITFRHGRTFVGDRDVSQEIRTLPVTEAASLVAQHADVRHALVAEQRRIAGQQDIVCEGRDQGTEVFPGAECKFYLTADARIRTQRRFRELSADQQTTDFDTLLQQIEERDRRDAERSIAPLRPADDAIIIDTGPL